MVGCHGDGGCREGVVKRACCYVESDGVVGCGSGESAQYVNCGRW